MQGTDSVFPKTAMMRDFRPSRETLFGALAFGIPLLVYAIFVCPTIGPSDSAEFVTAAAVWGVPHPPGYPLYTFLAGLVAHVPIGPLAWRVNLLSALFNAACVGLIYLCLRRLACGPAAALCGAFSLALSRVFWHYSEVAEVFALNDLLVAFLIYAALRWRESMEGDEAAARRWTFLCGLAIGGALSNQLTVILLLPGFAYWFWVGGLRPAHVWRGVGGLFLGLLAYLYLPLAAHGDPPLNWDNPQTMSGFLHTVLRMDWGTLTLINIPDAQSSARWHQVTAFLASFPNSFGWPAVMLGVWGMVALLRGGAPRRPLNVLLWTGFILAGPLFDCMGNIDFIHQPYRMAMLERFYIMPQIFFAIWIGYGCQAAAGLIERAAARAAMLATVLALAWIPSAVANQALADMRHETICRDVGANILTSLPPNSLYFVDGDILTMSVEYLQMAEGMRSDVIVLATPKLATAWYRDEVRQRFPRLSFPPAILTLPLPDLCAALTLQNWRERPVFGNLDAPFWKGVPWGMATRLMAVDAPLDWRGVAQTNFRLVGQYRIHVDRLYPPTSWESLIANDYTRLFWDVGQQLSTVHLRRDADECFRRSLELRPR